MPTIAGSSSADAQLMSESLALARLSAQAGARPFGAIIVVDGAVVGRGQDRSATIADPTEHAEIAAIREAVALLGLGALDTATVYASCEPCMMCAAAILRAGIRDVCFAASRETAISTGYVDVCRAELTREVLLHAATVRQVLDAAGEKLLREHPGRERFSSTTTFW
jgi:tRNA(Arg) A34 adenosine deaminase TadA